MRKQNVTIIMLLMFFIGLLILFYPTISNLYNEKNKTRIISNYEEILKSIDNSKYEEEKIFADKYNKKLNKIEEPLINYKSIPNYNKLLNINNDGMMGYLVIDKIKVELPIYHGTSNKVLASGVGHLKGSSLPIGGESIHSILSAHRGLPSAKLFSDLDKLEIGDTFKIIVLDEVLVYKVDKISVVKPSEINELKITKGKDYVTLLTCTPYGINTHRLLVRGVRVTKEDKKEYITTEAFKINKLIVLPLVSTPIIFLLLIILLIKPIKKDDINKYNEFIYPYIYKSKEVKK